MRKELKYLELIERYLNGELNAQEKAEFETKLSESETLRKEVEVQRTLMEAARRMGVKKQIQQSGKSFKYKAKLKTAIIATSIAVTGVVGGYFLLQSQDEEKSFEEGSTIELQVDIAESFKIDNTADQIVETEKGGVYVIPANAFEDAEGNLVEGPIEFEVEEAFSPFDIITKGLSTESNGELLETGGMFKLTGFKDGEELRLRPGKEILAEIPTDSILPDMSLWRGEELENGDINWVDPKPIENRPTPADILSLNFYPPLYLDSLSGMGEDAGNKHFTDSLYYSFASCFGNFDEPVKEDGAEQKNAIEFSNTSAIALDSSLVMVIVGPDNSDTIETEAESIYLENGSVINGINPARIKAIWDRKFNGTLLATKEFETRIAAIHETCNESVLNLYINNLDKPLWYIDSLASRRLSVADKEVFMAFSRERVGGINTTSSHHKLLQSYYEEKSRAYTEAVRKTVQSFNRKQDSLNRVSIDKQSQRQNREANNKAANFNQEFVKNLDDVYRQLGKKKPTPLPPGRYSVAVSGLGWNNIDRKVFAATSSRTSATFKEKGKTATLTYEPVNVEVKGEFDRVYAYVLPHDLVSYQRMNVKGENLYDFKLNALLSYDLVIVGFKGEQVFLNVDNKISPKSYSVKPKKSSQAEINRKLSRTSGVGANDILEDIAVEKFLIKDRKRLGANLKRAELRGRIRPVIFTCWEGDGYSEVPVSDIQEGE